MSNGHAKFKIFVTDLMSSYLEPIVKQKLEGPDFCVPYGSIEAMLFDGFMEISNSLETLQLIELFIKTVPPKEDGIHYSNYLTYHIHNYFQEMYILKERLKTYATKIKRVYTETVDKQLLEKNIISLISAITEALKNITGDGGIRNKHVHGRKFSDKELDWLASTTLLSSYKNEFEIHSIQAYERTKNKWHGIIENNNNKLKELVDLYFDTIYGTISIDGQVVLPKGYN